MLEKIRQFLLGFGHFNIDYLSGQVNGLSVYQDSFETKEYDYAGGGGLYRYGFCVELTSPYTADLNGENQMVVDEFVDFIERMNLKRQLPVLDDGMQAQSVKIVENMGKVSATPNTANFKLRLEMLYTK